MATNSLAQMRAKLNEQESKKNFSKESYSNGIYAFWDAPIDSTVILRLLPDGDSENPFFWQERLTMKIPFAGIKGADQQKEFKITLPCLENWGKTCPIQQAIKDYWNDEELKKVARIYYKKRSYLYQGFIVNSPIKEEKAPENPIRRFLVNSELHNKIKAALMNPEIEDNPIDFENGLDFRIIKKKSPGNPWPSYDTSEFSRKPRALTAEERAALEKFGLFDLKTFIGKEPDDETVKLMKEMFEDSLAGELFDSVKYKQFYKTNFNSTESADDDAPTESTAKKVEAPVQESKQVPVSDVLNKIRNNKEPAQVKPVEEAKTESVSAVQPKSSAEDVLAKLRNRTKKVD